LRKDYEKKSYEKKHKYIDSFSSLDKFEIPALLTPTSGRSKRMRIIPWKNLRAKSKFLAQAILYCIRNRFKIL
jgi:hypothetical protein